MITVNKYAEKAIVGVNELVDPTSIMVFAQLIIAAIEAFKSCKKPADEAVRISKEPGLYQKIILRNLVRRELGGRRNYRQLDGDDIVKSLIQAGKDVTNEDMQKMYDEVEEA